MELNSEIEVFVIKTSLNCLYNFAFSPEIVSLKVPRKMINKCFVNKLKNLLQNDIFAPNQNVKLDRKIAENYWVNKNLEKKL